MWRAAAIAQIGKRNSGASGGLILKALKWIFRHANVSSLSIMESPLIVHWDKSKTPRDRAEALPLPLYVIIAWERCLLEKGCTMLEKILLGSFLMMVWSGLRYSDLQRTIWKSISYNFAELRAICWRTKTCTKGQPYGLLASGFLSRGDHKSGTTRGCKTTRGTWTWERKSSDKRKRSDKNNTAVAILSSMAGWSSWRGCADLQKLQNCTEAEAWFCVLRTRCYNHWHSICACHCEATKEISIQPLTGCMCCGVWCELCCSVCICLYRPGPSKSCQMVPFQGVSSASLRVFIGTPIGRCWKCLFFNMPATWTFQASVGHLTRLAIS